MARRQVQQTSVVVVLLALALFSTLRGCVTNAPPEGDSSFKAGEYLFCLWNVENLFDDHLDKRPFKADREYDEWFSSQPAVLKDKLSKLTEALLQLNHGKGPDILALVEVENLRAAELLKDALNAQLQDPVLHYKTVLLEEVHAGRNIAPAIITRLPVSANRTRQIGGRTYRTLAAHVVVEGKELVILASHWTSRKTDKPGQVDNPDRDEGRDRYAKKLYGEFKAMYLSDPKVDVLICGDFNDTPEDESVVKYLHATGDLALVKKGGDDPHLLNLMAGKDPKQFGTHYYRKLEIYDQIVVSPGLLDDRGWTCDPNSVKTINTLVRPGDRLGRPWRFGSRSEQQPRGYSDHFPVTVRLTVQPGGVLAFNGKR